MKNDELERVLEIVARLVDTKKSDLLKSAEPDEGMPSSVLAAYTKGELVAEITFLNFVGHWRNRLEWYDR